MSDPAVIFRGLAPEDFDEGDLGNDPWDEGDLGDPSPEPESVYTFDEGDDAGLSNWFEIEIVGQAKRELEPTEPMLATDRSHIYEVRSATPTIDDYDLDAVRVRGLRPVTWTSLNPEVATVNANGEVHGVSAGTARIVASDGLLERTITLTIAVEVDYPTPIIYGFVEGSFAAAMADGVELRVEGKTPGDATKRIFSSSDHATATYVRSATCWAAGADISCIAAARKTPGNNWSSIQRIVAISPRHGSMADHARDPIGTMYRFVTMAGEVVERTMIDRQRISSAGTSKDICIGLFDEDLPETILPAQILPDDIAAQIPIIQDIPIFQTDQERNALVTRSRYDGGCFISSDDPLFPWREEIVVGDSGAPSGFIAETFVLRSQATFAPSGSGTGLRTHAAEINAMMATLDARNGVTSGYQLSRYDLSPFNTYE